MNQLRLFRETLALYRKHGWRLARVLMRADTLAELEREDGARRFEGEDVRPSEVDAMWFRRASPGDREAWELRLVADTPYALFELFEADEEEEDRDDVRREMEARLREYAAAGRA